MRFGALATAFFHSELVAGKRFVEFFDFMSIGPA